MAGTGRPHFVLFGSSIVEMSYDVGGWGAVLADLYARKDADVQPSMVIVYFGGNDATNPHHTGLGAHVPLLEYLDNMKKIIAHIKSLSDKTRIICLSSPPVNETRIREIFGNALDDQARTNEGCRIYSEGLVELCQEMDVEAINLFAAIQQRGDWANTCFIDGIHLTAEGSKIVAKEILKVLKKVEWEPSLYWLTLPDEFPEDSPYYVVGLNGKTTLNMTGLIYTSKKQWLNI